MYLELRNLVKNANCGILPFTTPIFSLNQTKIWCYHFKHKTNWYCRENLMFIYLVVWCGLDLHKYWYLTTTIDDAIFVDLIKTVPFSTKNSIEVKIWLSFTYSLNVKQKGFSVKFANCGILPCTTTSIKAHLSQNWNITFGHRTKLFDKWSFNTTGGAANISS